MDTSVITPQPATKNHKGLKVASVVFLVMLLLVSLGYNVYLWNQYTTITSQVSNVQSDNNKLNDQNVKLTQEVDIARNKTEPTTPAMPVLTDQEAVQKAAQLYWEAYTSDSKAIATISNIKGDFASAGLTFVNSPIGAIGAYLKKIHGEWVVVWTGQNGPDKATGDRLGLPAEWYNSTN